MKEEDGKSLLDHHSNGHSSHTGQQQQQKERRKVTVAHRLAGLAAFVLPTVASVFAHAALSATSQVTASMAHLAMTIIVLGITLVLLHETKLLWHSHVWNLIHIDELTLFAFCYVAFQLIDIHTEIYTYLDDENYHTFPFIVGLIRQIVVTVLFIVAFQYVYRTHHGNSAPASNREVLFSYILCGFGLAEALDMILLPAIAPSLYLTLIEHTRFPALWLNFGLIRPLAVVFVLDSAVCVAYGSRNWTRIIFRPHVVRDSFHSNNPSLGIAVCGIIYIALMLFGHYGYDISPIFTIVIAYVDAALAIFCLLWLFILYIRPNCGRGGLLNFFSWDRFTYVLIGTCIGLLCALTAWIIVIPRAIINNDTVVFSDFLRGWQVLFGFHMLDGVLHVLFFVYAFNCRDKHQRTVANYYLYAASVFLLLHNLCLWLLNTDYEISISISVEHGTAQLLEGMWPLVVEFRMVCVALFGLIISHKPGCSSRHAVAPAKNTFLDALFGTGTNLSPAQRRIIEARSAHIKENLSYAAPGGRVNIDFIYFTPKPWFMLLPVITLVMTAIFVVLGTDNERPLEDAARDLFFISDDCLLFGDLFSHGSGSSHENDPHHTTASSHTTLHHAAATTPHHDDGHGAVSTTLSPEALAFGVHTHVQVSFAFVQCAFQLVMLSYLVYLLVKTLRPFTRAMSIPVRVQILYILACGSFVYRLDNSLFSVSVEQWPVARLDQVHRVLESLSSFLDLLLMMGSLIFTMYISQVAAHLKGEDYLNAKYNFTRRQWMGRYALAGYLVAVGILELFLGSYGGNRLLEYVEAINGRHRFLFLGILRIINVFTSLQLGFLMLPKTLMKATISVLMGQLRLTGGATKLDGHSVTSSTSTTTTTTPPPSTSSNLLQEPQRPSPEIPNTIMEEEEGGEGEEEARGKHGQQVQSSKQHYSPESAMSLSSPQLEMGLDDITDEASAQEAQAVARAERNERRFSLLRRRRHDNVVVAPAHGPPGVEALVQDVIIGENRRQGVKVPAAFNDLYRPRGMTVGHARQSRNSHQQQSGVSIDQAAVSPLAEFLHDDAESGDDGGDGEYELDDFNDGDGVGTVMIGDGDDEAGHFGHDDNLPLLSHAHAESRFSEDAATQEGTAVPPSATKHVMSHHHHRGHRKQGTAGKDGHHTEDSEYEEAVTVLPISFLIPGIILCGYILGIQYGACKTELYSSVAWLLVSLFNIFISVYLIMSYFGTGSGFNPKCLPSLLEKRRFTIGVTATTVLVLCLFSFLVLGLLLTHEEASSPLIAAEVMRRVDLLAAMAVCVCTYARREKRQYALLFSNRAYVMSLLLAASQFAIAFANIDVYVRFNGPMILHTRQPASDAWAVALYPITILARVGVAFLLTRQCLGIREHHSQKH